jgi:hypothetical protein
MIAFSSWENESLALVVDLLQQAIARDPGFFLAYYELAYTHDKAYIVGVDHTPARLALAEHAVEAGRRLRRTRERRIWPMLTISTVPTSITIARAPSLFLHVSSCQMARLFSNRMAISTERALKAMGTSQCIFEDIELPSEWCQGFVARAKGDSDAAHAAFQQARPAMEKIVRDQPDYAAGLCAGTS